MFRVSRSLCINPALVSWMSIDSRNRANGSGPALLIICMQDGTEHRIEHTAQYTDGDDVYEIERRLFTVTAS